MATDNTGDWFTAQGAPPMVAAPTATTAFGTSGGGTTSIPTMAERTGATSGGGGQYQPYNEGVMRSILEKYTPDYAGVRRASEEIDRTFGPGVVKLLDHPTKLDKFQLPNGQVIDTVIGAGGSNPTWTWAPEGGGSGGGGAGTLGGLSGVGVTPQGMAFVNRVMGDMGAVGPLLGDPMAGRPITDDPSFGFRMSEGAKALERSAAAKGTLLTGGAEKAMQRYAQDYASTEYQNSYNRRASEQNNNYNRLLGVGNFMSGEQQNQFGRYQQTANLGLNATNNAQQNQSGYAGNIANAQYGQGNAAAGFTAANAQNTADLYTGLGNIAGSAMTNYYGNQNAGIGGAVNPNPYVGLRK